MADRKPVCSLLHLSDMHLGASFEEKGGEHRGFFSALFRNKSFVNQSHDFMLLLLLPLEIKKIARLNQVRFAQAWPQDKAPEFFDRVIVSGDISTDATDNDRFKFAYDFLTSEIPLQSSIHMGQATVGLNVPNNLLMSLPGNHDKMREKTLERFNKAFGKSPEPCNYLQAIRCKGKLIIFFVMDSNAYNEGDLALGQMDIMRLGWLVNKFEDIDSVGLTLNGETFSVAECANAIRCLVLHHHVCSLSIGKRFINFEKSFTRMTGSDDLLKIISGRIHIILHGHEHYPTHFIEPQSKAVLISAGTTSQWHKKKRKNSFYHLTIFNDDTLQIDEYVWDGTGFKTRQSLKGQTEPLLFPLPKLS